MSQKRSRQVRRQWWRQVLEQWSRSGLSQSAYCRKRRLSRACFAWWKRRLLGAAQPPKILAPAGGGRRRASGGNNCSVSAAFLPVVLRPQPATGEWACELEWPDGTRLRWKGYPDPQVLAGLLRAPTSAGAR